MQKRALAARAAHSALLDLRALVDEAAKTTHAAEMEAVHLAIHPREPGDVSATLRKVVQRLDPGNFEETLVRVRESLQTAMA
jgi:hypothetical protein